MRRHAATARRLRLLSNHLAGSPVAAVAERPGFGPVLPSPTPLDDADAIVGFFEREGYALIADALDSDELAYLNEFCDRTRASEPEIWGIGGPMDVDSYSQPLLDWPELERFAMHASTLPLVRRLCGEGCTFAQFDFRHTPEGAGPLHNRFHRDLGQAFCTIVRGPSSRLSSLSLPAPDHTLSRTGLPH